MVTFNCILDIFISNFSINITEVTDLLRLSVEDTKVVLIMNTEALRIIRICPKLVINFSLVSIYFLLINEDINFLAPSQPPF